MAGDGVPLLFPLLSRFLNENVRCRAFGVVGSHVVARGERTCIGESSSWSVSACVSSIKLSFRELLLLKMLAKRFLAVLEGLESLAPSSWFIVVVEIVCFVLVRSTVKDRGVKGVGLECEQERKTGLGNVVEVWHDDISVYTHSLRITYVMMV